MPVVIPAIAAIAGAAVTGLGAAGIISVTTAAIISFGITVLSSVVGLAFKGSKRPSQRDSGIPVTIREPIPFRQRLYGRKRVGGKIVFGQFVNQNRWLLLVVAVSEGPIKGPQKVFLDDEVVWEPTGAPQNGDMAQWGQWLNGVGNQVYMEFYDGTQTAASSQFVSWSTGDDAPLTGNPSVILSDVGGVTLTEETVAFQETQTGRDNDVVVSVNRTQVTASWTAPTGGTVQKYRVSYNDVNGRRAAVFVPGDETSLVLGTNPLITAATASVSVAAQDEDGNWTDAVDPDGNPEQRAKTWGADRIGTGVAYVAMRLIYTRERFPRGIPNITFEMEGAKDVYDPRTEASGYTRNSALVARHYLLDPMIGLGASADEIDDADWAAHATMCDEQVETEVVDVLENRYETHGLVIADEGRDATILELAAAMGSDIVWSGGVFKPVGGDVGSVVYSFTDNDIMGPFSMPVGRGRRETFNTVIGEFTSPANDYIPTSYPARSDPAYVTEDGRRITRNASFPFTNSADMAQRLANAVLREGRKKVFPAIPLPMSALALEVGDIVAWTSARYGFDAAQFRVDRISINHGQPSEDGGAPEPIVVVTLSEADADQFQLDQAALIRANVQPRRKLPAILVWPPRTPTYQIIPLERQDGTIVTRSVVDWEAPLGGDIYGYNVLYTYQGVQQSAFTTDTETEIDRPIANVFVQAVSFGGQVSAAIPAVLVGDFVIRDTEAPPAPTSSALTVLTSGAGGEVILRLDPSPAPDFAAFCVFAAPLVNDTNVDASVGTNSEFVTRLYAFYFDREPDAAGLAFWTNKIDTAELTRAQVEEQFALADEDAFLVAESAATVIVIEGLARGVEYRILARAKDRSGNISTAFFAGAIEVGGVATTQPIRDQLPTSDIMFVTVPEAGGAVSTGTRLSHRRAPRMMRIYDVRASLKTASDADTVVDVKVGGASIFSTPVTIPAGQLSSLTGPAPVIVSGVIENDAELLFEVTSAGSGGENLVVALYVVGAGKVEVIPPPEPPPSGFDPVSLFGPADFGVVYDLGVPETVFSDLAETALAVSGGTVLSVRNRVPTRTIPSPNPQLVANGTFDSDVSGWSPATKTPTLTWQSGLLRLAQTLDFSSVSTPVTCNPGDTYLVSADYVASSIAGNAAFLIVSTDAGSYSVDRVDIASSTSPGTLSGTFRATRNTHYIHLVGGATGGGSQDFDNVSMQLSAMANWGSLQKVSGTGSATYNLSSGKFLLDMPAGPIFEAAGAFSGAAYTIVCGLLPGTNPSSARVMTSYTSSAGGLDFQQAGHYLPVVTFGLSGLPGRTDVASFRSGVFSEVLSVENTGGAVAFRYKGVGSDNPRFTRRYNDDAQVETSADVVFTSFDRLRSGGTNADTEGTFDGAIGFFMMINRALTDEEMASVLAVAQSRVA